MSRRDPQRDELACDPALAREVYEALSPVHRKVVEFVVIEGLSKPAAAFLLGVSPADVETWLYEAQEQLRLRIAQERCSTGPASPDPDVSGAARRGGHGARRLVRRRW